MTAAILQLPRRDAGVLDRPLTPGFQLQDVLDEVSKTYLSRALRQAEGRKSVAARLLGFSSYQTLDNRLARLQINADTAPDEG